MLERISDFERVCIPPSSTIREALEKLAWGGQAVFVVEKGTHRLSASVSDGDIRRALLNGAQLHESVLRHANRDPITLPANLCDEVIESQMRRSAVRVIPLLGSDRKVLAFAFNSTRESVTPARPNHFMVMAGGRGQRLNPYTEDCPKPMLELNGKPMLHHIVDRARSCGFVNFIFSVNYLKELIEEYFGDGSNFGVSISYIYEDSPLGTAGALGYAQIPGELPVLVTNGDVMSEIDYGALLDYHNQHGAEATMAVRQVIEKLEYGVVQTTGRAIVKIEEKPEVSRFINAGVYVLNSEVYGGLEPGRHADMPDLFTCAIEAGLNTVAYPVHEQWIDVGRPTDYEFAERVLKKWVHI